MNSNSIRGRALPGAALLIALVAVVAVVASGALGRAGDPAGPTPSTPPSGSPTSTPKPTPSPTPEPSDPPADGIFTVDLNTVDDHDVKIVVADRTGTVVEVSSGNAGDGMSVRWFDMKVENLDAETLRLTWVGLPRDEAVKLFVSQEDGKVRLLFVQAAPPINSDALGFDRIVVLRFDAPVSADDVVWSMQEGFDTAD
jgi:hypothetical protein